MHGGHSGQLVERRVASEEPRDVAVLTDSEDGEVQRFIPEFPPEHAIVGQELAVEYMTERYPVTVQCADSTPLFDPDNERVKAADAIPA